MSTANDEKYKKWAIAGAAGAAAVAGTYILYRWMTKKPAEEKETEPVPASSAPAAETAAATPTPEPVKAKKPKKEKVKKTETKETTPAASGVLSRENLIAMFSEMVDEMSATMYRLTMQISEMQQRGKNDDEINTFFQTEYQGSIERAHDRLLGKYNTTEAAADDAAKLHAEDPEFKKLLAQIEKLQRTISGQGASEEELNQVPDWLDMDKVIEIFTEVMNTVTESIITSMRTVHEKHAGSPVPEAQIEKEIQAMYKKTIEDKKKAVFANFQINEELLDLALSKYSQRQQLSQAIIQMQMRQKQQVERARALIRAGDYKP